MPLCSQPGAEAEVDWGEAIAVIAGVPTKVYLFLMRSCFSGACFVQAHVRENQQAFLEGHVAGLGFFDGVFGLVRYDNLGSAVAKVMKGRRRIESDRFVALRSHYLYESSFTRTGKEGAHEKGGVEGDVGRFRRTYLVPVPAVASLAELNDRIAAACITDLGRTIRGRRQTVGEALSHAVELLRGLPAERFDTDEHATSCSATTGACSPVTSGCRGGSRSARSWITTSSCLPSSRARSPARSRSDKSANAGAGRIASISSGPGLPSGSAHRRPPGRWSTCSCSAASCRSRRLSSLFEARSLPARSMVVRSLCSRAAPSAPNGPVDRSRSAADRGRSARTRPDRL